MGGRALQKYGIETERKSSVEFYKIAADIAVQLSFGLGITSSIPVVFNYSPSIAALPVRCYRTKQDHGDLDVLIKVDQKFELDNIDLRKYIEQHFNPQVIHSNGGVLSFDYKNFQIDFIPIKEENWDIAQVYFSYDPLGNAMGKTFHKMNLSYGWDGLKYKYRNFNGRNSHNIVVSKDPRKIFKFSGYDYDRYLNGFETIEEIFDFIVAGKQFHIDVFRMENLNHVDKKRNRKRKSYHAFLEYIEKLENKTPFQFERNKSFYLPIIDNYFPEANLLKQIDVLDARDEINRQLSEKFNGRLVMEWIPDLEGKMLGNAMKNFKVFLGDHYEHIVLETTEEELKERFVDHYKNFYGKN